MESATYTVRLKAISSPVNSTAGQLGSVTDTTALKTRREVRTNRRGFPQSKRFFKFSSREAGAQGARVPPWVTTFKLHMENIHPRLPEIPHIGFTLRHLETVTSAATAAGGSYGAWQEALIELMGLPANPFKMSKSLRQCALCCSQRAPWQERGS